MKYLLVINPVSGDYDKEDFLSKAGKLFNDTGHEIEFFKTTGKNDFDNLIENIKAFDPKRIIAAGGDGTVLLAARAVMEKEIPLGIIPMGSANGMSAELKINPIPMDALQEILMSVKEKSLDLIKVNDEHYSIHIGDIGTNAEIVHKFEQNDRRGMASYAKFFFEELRNSEPFKVKIKTNEAEFEEEAIMLAICNGRTYGTGIPINIKGKPGDGLFELVLIKEINFNALIKAGLSKFDERFFSEEGLRIVSTKYAEISLEKERTLQLDGEIIGKVNNIKIEIVPSAVKLIVKE